MDNGKVSCICGAVLVEEVTERGVRPLGSSQVIPFRRETDYVMCETCLRTYRIGDLMREHLDVEPQLEVPGEMPPGA